MKEFLLDVLTPELMGAIVFLVIHGIIFLVVGLIEYNKDLKRQKLALIEAKKNAEEERLLAIKKEKEENYRRLVSMNVAISSKNK